MEDFRSFADEGNGVLLITHDLKLALTVADRVLVFYAGTTVEAARAEGFSRMRVCSAIPIQGRFIVRCRSMGLGGAARHAAVCQGYAKGLSFFAALSAG